MSEPAAEGGGATAPATLDGALKLVVWDLDDTLWSGTLSEGEVELDPARAELVRTLNRRGIVNAICSKNDLAAARARLEAEGLWEEFVFPSIDWTPKGPRIARIVEDMQLRPPNVLFVDDNVTNLQEALHFVPSLQIAGPELLDRLLSLPQAAGKDDSALTRLAQYRTLERKAADRAALEEGSNEDFLRSCEIRVAIAPVGPQDHERVRELVNRSNQLNFTKSRLSEEQLAALLAEPGRETRVVRVRDRYGDYGLCGFYSLAGGTLTDYVFSCRILHMGVEQWLHARLGGPDVTVRGDVAATLDAPASVDWITLDDGDRDGAGGARDGAGGAVAAAPPRRRFGSSRVLLKGGCDLWLLNGFLGGSILNEFTYPSPSGAEVHADHTEILRRDSEEVMAAYGEEIERIPFLDRAAYRSRVVRSPKSLGTVIFSVLMDYTQGLYGLRGGDLVVPYGQLDNDATDPDNWPQLERRYGEVGLDRAFLEWFAERFEFRGAIGPDAFKENIRWLAGRLRPRTRLVLINGAEVPLENPREPDRHRRHIVMNRALEEVAAELGDVAVCDVRKFVTSPDDFKDNIRHYKRETYLRMAQELAGIVSDDLDVEQRPLVMRMRRARRRFARNAERAAFRLRLR